MNANLCQAKRKYRCVFNGGENVGILLFVNVLQTVLREGHRLFFNGENTFAHFVVSEYWNLAVGISNLATNCERSNFAWYISV